MWWFDRAAIATLLSSEAVGDLSSVRKLLSEVTLN